MRRRTALRITAATVSGAVIVGAIVALAALRPPQTLVDDASGAVSSWTHRVGQRRIVSYCPDGMTLADGADDYGDSEYRESAGDIRTASRMAAFGAVYDSSLSPLAEDGKGAAPGSMPTDADDAVVYAGGDLPAELDTELLRAGRGDGQAGTVVSTATDGDLRGISAVSCPAPATRQSFLLPGTRTGTTQRLTVANLSSKSTTATVTIRGTERSGQLALSGSSTLTVGPRSEGTLDLSATAGDQDGLFVTVDSGQTPVSAVVRTVRMDGLTPHGSDFAPATAAPASRLTMPSVRGGDDVSVLVHAARAGSATLSWVDGDGRSEAKKVTFQADRVAVVALGKAPDGTLAVGLDADVDVSAALLATRSGKDGQQDFALSAASGGDDASTGMALPDGVDAELTFAAREDATGPVTVTVTPYDGKGAAGKPTSLDIDPGGAASYDTDGAAAVSVSLPRGTCVWGARLTDPDLDRAKVAGLSMTGPTPLTVRERTVRALPSPDVVR